MPATQASATAISLKMFFRWIEEKAEVKVSPMRKLKPPKVRSDRSQ